MSRLARFAKSPLLHFLVLGVVLFASSEVWQKAETAAPPPGRDSRIVLSRTDVELLEQGFRERWGFPPNAAQRRALLDQAVLDEMLYREARFLSLDLEDGSVQRRLVEKMRWVSDRPGRPESELVREANELGLDDDVVIRRLLGEKMRLLLQRGPGGTRVDDADLQEQLDRGRAELEMPARRSVTQVFLATDVRGDHTLSDARDVLAKLRSGSWTADQAGELSDPFPIGTELRSYSELRLQARFGKPFAEQVFALDRGVWSEPIASPYGVHLVRVEDVQEAGVPPLEQLRPTLTRAVMRERAKENLSRGLSHLQTRYEVEIDGEDSAPGRRTRAGERDEAGSIAARG
ncbi:MAG: peptidyl-prolyl cis-trans isomerase [Deltaproteobacteria bacterium]|nr:peptidyl-prolyl cis-trans isomerase [Deltaproteobacteria bacterium]